MDFSDMQLGFRANMFSNVISNTICTDLFQNEIVLEQSMNQLMAHLRLIKLHKNTLYIVGNGGSAAVASHALVDFVNVAKINAQVLHESSLITCMANDFGYENAYARVLLQFIKPQDMLIVISSSGRSENIINAARAAKERNARVVTFTGFHANNPVRSIGDYNYWLASNDYGYVEVGHQFILHNLSDRFGVENVLLANQSAVEENVF